LANRTESDPVRSRRPASLLEHVVGAVRDLYGARLVSCAVFGSVGRGTPRYDSDVDLILIVHDLPRGRMARVEEFLPVEERISRYLAGWGAGTAVPSLSPIFKTPEEAGRGSPIFLDMTEDGRILYDTDGFLAARLGRVRARLQELGAKRIRRGNARHWVLKPDLKPGEVFEL
jgi:predicted nucleotidyltransferase